MIAWHSQGCTSLVAKQIPAAATWIQKSEMNKNLFSIARWEPRCHFLLFIDKVVVTPVFVLPCLIHGKHYLTARENAFGFFRIIHKPFVYVRTCSTAWPPMTLAIMQGSFRFHKNLLKMNEPCICILPKILVNIPLDMVNMLLLYTPGFPSPKHDLVSAETFESEHMAIN